MSEERSLEKISEMLSRARLNANDLKPLTQTLYFTSQNLYQDTYRLLQLDNILENEIIKGNTLYIKGDDDEELVICTENRTFHVMESETSNSLLLTNNLTLNEKINDNPISNVNKVEIKTVFHSYLIPSLAKPNLKKLHGLLKDTIYRGPEFEYKVDKEKLLSIDDLKKVVQASNVELEEALSALDVIKIDNKIRLLEDEYHFRVLSYMLKLIEENSWALDEIDFDEILTALVDLVPREILIEMFEKYAEESKVVDSLQLYRYNEKRVCTFFAKILLHSYGKFNFDEFMQAWKESVPEGMQPNEEMLYGIAIIDRNSKPNVIFEFDEKDLPDNIMDRFRVLFDAKERWSVEEITPYIRPLTTEKVDVSTLLAKHARAFNVDGVKYYSSKHGK